MTLSTAPDGLGDLDRLAGLQVGDEPVFAGPLSGELIEGGKSNLTYRITDGQRTLALRRPPLGHVLPTAHDMAREFRVLSALAPTDVPVPRPVLLYPDTDLLGATFYLMEWVDGTVYRDLSQTSQLSSDQAADLADRMMAVLARLHSLDPADVGLGDFGRPEGFLERQVRRWKKQLDASRSRPLPGADELHARLADSIPDSPAPAIVHGDYRLDNTIVADGEIAAVVDWEMTTVGDPLTDLGLLVVYWDGLSSLPGGVSMSVGPESPFPRAAELIASYQKRRPADLSALPWYTALGYFKLAVINEGIYYRYIHGQTVGAGFENMGDHTISLVELGHAVLEEG